MLKQSNMSDAQTTGSPQDNTTAITEETPETSQLANAT